MKKRDRIERAVASLYTEERVGPWRMNEARFIEVVGKLIYAEAAYQRVQVRRIVQQKRKLAGIRTAYQRDRETKGKVISAYTLACDDILSALQPCWTAKGKP